jgi:hypothetical protein
MSAVATEFNTNASLPKDAIFGDFRGDCFGDIESCVNGMTFSLRILIPSTLTETTRLIGTKMSNRGMHLNYVPPDIVVSMFFRLKKFQVKFRVAKDKQYHFAMVYTKKKTMRVVVNGVQIGNDVGQETALLSEPDTILKIGRTDLQKGKFRISDVIIWKRELSSEEINQKLACSHVGIGKA